MPIQYSIDEAHLQLKGLTNYWGYNVLNSFAISPRFVTRPRKPLDDFKTMVKELHKEGIEVILDMVFNHTADGAKQDPLLCQQGIDADSYYWKDEHGDYLNWSGCGNTINASNPAVLQWILDCLKFWVEECHVDGFRFDLASILGRSGSGDFSSESVFFKAIQNDECFKNIKFIAEPWDIGGNGYQLGKFPAPFAEWNGRFRDEMKRFFLHESGNLGEFATRFSGSSDLFHNRCASASINYISAHDGFTLQDLVSYNDKHNLANGENNQDGHHDNISNNYGIEGETDDSSINEMRLNSKQALMAALLLSNGTPMIRAGDEFGNTQYGNNNAYCQDNETSWLDWSWYGKRASPQAKFIAFIGNLVKLRKKLQTRLPHDDIGQSQFWTEYDVKWLNVKGEPMCLEDWENFATKAMQIRLATKFLILVNSNKRPQEFLLPEAGNGELWKLSNGSAHRGRHFTCENFGLTILSTE